MGKKVNRKSIAALWLAQDPAEPWETPYTEQEGGFYYRGYYAGHPSVPKKQDELPAGVFEALRDACCAGSLGQLLVIPSCVRLVGQGSRKVITPLEVMGVGSRAVGLWTEKPLPGLKVTIPLEELCAIEDVHILLYGKLSFISSNRKLTIRYNTVCRRVLEPLLFTLRKALAGPALTLPCRADANGAGTPGGRQAAIPFKWNFLLHYPFSTLDDAAPRVFRFSEEPRRRAGKRSRAARGHLMIVTPYELVSLCDPPESFHSYGVDSLFIPRARIREVTLRAKGVEVTAGGASFSLSLAPDLLSAMSGWFSEGSGSRGPLPAVSA
jgi:hypothetical protein